MFIQSSVVVECLCLFSSGSCPGCYWRLYDSNISIQIFRKGLREKGKVLIYWETSLLRDGVGYFMGVFWWIQIKGGRLRQNNPFKLNVLSNPWILFLPSHTIHLTKQKEPPPRPVCPMISHSNPFWVPSWDYSHSAQILEYLGWKLPWS